VNRILHVVGSMNVGGAETMLMNLYRVIERTHVQFDFLVFGDGPGAYDNEIRELGGRLVHVPEPRSRGVRGATADVRHALREYGPYRALHAHILHASAISLRAAAAEGVEISIENSHSTGDVWGGLRRRMYVRWARGAIRHHSTQLVACGADAGAYLFGDHDRRFEINGVSAVDSASVSPAGE
jgi:glycosyltransferase EpsF